MSCALGHAVLGAAAALAGLDTEEKPLTEKDGGHQTPTQSFLPLPHLPLSFSLRVNNSIRTVPEIAVMPVMMPRSGPSNHLILTKHPAHTE